MIITNREIAPVNHKQLPQTRIHNLDTLRGVAVLGILIMNGVSFGLGTTAYFNISIDTADATLGRSLAIAGEIVADQKFMALFSILFGAGVVLFYERLAARCGSTRAVWLSLWRNALLLFIGLLHTVFWDGDVLLIYAMVAPLILLVRHLPSAVLFASGVGFMLLSVFCALLVQRYVDSTIHSPVTVLGEYWLDPNFAVSDVIGLWLIGDSIARALGMMLIGICLYRCGFLSGVCSRRIYTFTAISGTAFGWLLAASGVVWLTDDGFTADLALIGGIPNTVGTLPAVLGYIAIITLLVPSRYTQWHQRLSAIGRMALSNYLMQTVIGLFVFTYLLDTTVVSRSIIFVFVVSTWILQLWWSKRWLDLYTQGPIEWLWRCATHRQWLPLRRNTTSVD